MPIFRTRINDIKNRSEMNINTFKKNKNFTTAKLGGRLSSIKVGFSVRPEKVVKFIKNLWRKYKLWRGGKMEKKTEIKFKYLTPEVIERVKKYEPIIALGVRKYFGGFDGVNLADLTLWIEAQFIAENNLKMTITERRVNRATREVYFVEVKEPNRAGAIGIAQIKQETFDMMRKLHPEIPNDIWNEKANILAGISYDAWLFGRLRKVMPTLDYIELMDWIFAEYNWRLGLWERFGKIEQPLPIRKCPPETQNYIAKIHEIHSELILIDI